MAKVLFLSYDGASDPLGQSQILPYLKGLTQRGHEIHLVTFEKHDSRGPVQVAVTAQMRIDGIRWHPLPYTKHPAVLSTMWDVCRLRHAVDRLQEAHRFDLVHCRSYVTSIVGLRLKRTSRVRFLFDMRGFWADEKVEGGSWNLANPLFRRIYQFFKSRESEYIAEADGIISLTHAGRREIETWSSYGVARPPVEVIPCAADFDMFPAVTAETRAAAREALKIPAAAFVAVYLGSLGTWYLLGEMLDWFGVLCERRPDSRFLVVTHESPAVVFEAADARGIDQNRIVVIGADRGRVPFLLSAADVGLFFIRPTFSKRSSSPTKLGEYLATGLPVVTNAGIGDVDSLVESLQAGVIVSAFSREAYARSIDRLAPLDCQNAAALRARARSILDLEVGVAAYDRLYRALVN